MNVSNSKWTAYEKIKAVIVLELARVRAADVDAGALAAARTYNR
jgi:hypothetical protein